MSGFDADWLALREPFDLAARDRALEQAFVTALGRATPIRLADLGGGTAANFRALAPRIAGDQHWLLLDHDAALRAAAPAAVDRWARAQGWSTRLHADGCEVRTGDACWTLATRPIDLAASLESIDAAAFDGIVTTAFLDLVSAPWLDRLARWLVAAGRPLLATLTVDGLRRWAPAMPEDATIDRAFRLHQGGDKGFGESIGPGAATHLADTLRALGWAPRLVRSDWAIGPSHGAMLQRMCDEAVQVAQAVAGDDPGGRARIEAWRAMRRAAIAQGSASLVIGHVDLFASPAR